MHVRARLHQQEGGFALPVAVMVVALLLALGFALVALVDVQSKASVTERTRDRGFNLSESVLTDEAFVLGRNWPASAITSGTPTPSTPLQGQCGAVSQGSTILSPSVTPAAPAGSAASLLDGTLNAAYDPGSDASYTGATWQFTLCDNTVNSTVWSDALLTNLNWDSNHDNMMWVRAQSTVAGRTRRIAGLVRVRSGAALPTPYGLVTGSVSEDLSATSSAITNTAILGMLTGNLLTTNPLVAPDAMFPSPQSGVIGVRCGLLDSTVAKPCVTGTIAATSASPAFKALVTGGAYTQFPTVASADDNTIAQLRAQAKASGTYSATSPGDSNRDATPATSTAAACQITGSPNANTVVFIEKVGTGDQACVLDVKTSRAYKAFVVASGRIVIRGNNKAVVYDPNGAANVFTGSVYALNQQSSATERNQSTPAKQLVRIEQGARVRGAVHADGKNAATGIVPPDFDSAMLTTTVLTTTGTCPGVGTVGMTLCSTATSVVSALGLNAAVDALTNGLCLVQVGALCTVGLPALGQAPVVSGLNSQLTSYGAGVRSDVAVVKALTTYGDSGVVPGTFQDLQPTQ